MWLFNFAVHNCRGVSIHCALLTSEMSPKEYIIKLLEEAVAAIKADTSEIDTDTAIKIADILAHKTMSREEACIYLNLSYSKFYKYVDEGKIPKGRKRTGWKELCWYKDELDKCKIEHNL